MDRTYLALLHSICSLFPYHTIPCGFIKGHPSTSSSCGMTVTMYAPTLLITCVVLPITFTRFLVHQIGSLSLFRLNSSLPIYVDWSGKPPVSPSGYAWMRIFFLSQTRLEFRRSNFLQLRMKDKYRLLGEKETYY